MNIPDFTSHDFIGSRFLAVAAIPKFKDDFFNSRFLIRDVQSTWNLYLFFNARPLRRLLVSSYLMKFPEPTVVLVSSYSEIQETVLLN